jgi:hypothetical protein
MSYLGSHRPRLHWFRVALALCTVLGLFAAGAVPAAIADPGDDGGECSSGFDGGFVVLDDDCDDDGEDDGDDVSDAVSDASRPGRYRLELISASCRMTSTGTTYSFEAIAGRALRSKTATIQLLDATSGIRVLSSVEPAPGRQIELSGTVAKRVGRIGVGLVDVRGRYLKLLTVRCTTA